MKTCRPAGNGRFGIAEAAIKDAEGHPRDAVPPSESGVTRVAAIRESPMPLTCPCGGVNVEAYGEELRYGRHQRTPGGVSPFVGPSAQRYVLLRVYQTGGWESELLAFRSSHGALLEIYQRQRRMREIPIRTSTGEEIRLSPGRHNRLQGQVVTDFGPKFAPGSTLLYLGDAADKLLHLDKDKLADLGVPITEHDKLPDVVLYDEERDWLFLVEAVTSHGPVSPKRVEELEVTLKDCVATRVYVSAFPDFRQFKQHVDKIAWETEVWIAEIPDHLIHFNGDKFLGPSRITVANK